MGKPPLRVSIHRPGTVHNVSNKNQETNSKKAIHCYRIYINLYNQGWAQHKVTVKGLGDLLIASKLRSNMHVL